MITTDYIDPTEGRDTPAAKACYNCGETRCALTPVAINCAILDNAWSCDECMEEEARLQDEALELARYGECCKARDRIVNTAQSTRELVNALKAHDQAGCIACNVGKCDDCEASFPQSDLIYDADYKLQACPSCHAKQLRLDAIIERHKADNAAA
jgi:hypothetical protein